MGAAGRPKMIRTTGGMESGVVGDPAGECHTLRGSALAVGARRNRRDLFANNDGVDQEAAGGIPDLDRELA